MFTIWSTPINPHICSESLSNEKKNFVSRTSRNCEGHRLTFSKLPTKGFSSQFVSMNSGKRQDEKGSKTYTPELVALWSNHRVMEWLRTVDLSEYAPNLRGSGVHGALIVYEPKFNTNLFATLLNIPPTKTLLRRHLATHFKHIVGEELTQIKREKETETPLSPSVKIKTVRKTQFALKKKRSKNEIENEDYICPMDIPITTDIPKFFEAEKLVVRRNSDPSPQEQRHLDLKGDTVERIGSVSKEIASLTTVLQDENLNEAPTTIV
ncbi:liprin-beta-1 [Trichonephila clavipes]|nr:liprin-beta-1 [Trichonephila clavipes]